MSDGKGWICFRIEGGNGGGYLFGFFCLCSRCDHLFCDFVVFTQSRIYPQIVALLHAWPSIYLSHIEITIYLFYLTFTHLAIDRFSTHLLLNDPVCDSCCSFCQSKCGFVLHNLLHELFFFFFFSFVILSFVLFSFSPVIYPPYPSLPASSSIARDKEARNVEE